MHHVRHDDEEYDPDVEGVKALFGEMIGGRRPVEEADAVGECARTPRGASSVTSSNMGFFREQDGKD